MKNKNRLTRQALALLLIGGSLMTVSCAHKSEPMNVIVPAPALREVFRGGEIQGLQDNSGQFIGGPTDYDLVEHVCTSRPIFDIYGKYVRTSVKCF